MVFGEIPAPSQCKHYKQPYRFTIGVLIVSCQLSPALYLLEPEKHSIFAATVADMHSTASWSITISFLYN